MRNKVILGTLVALAFALAAYIGVKGVVVAGPVDDAAAEATRKVAFEAALRRGNLSLYEAKYARTVAPSAETAAGP